MTRGTHELLLLTNGPGELLTWVRPLLQAVRAHDASVAIKIVILPCQFGSGRETTIASTFGADLVVSPHEFARSMAQGRAPKGVGAKRGIVVQLGGSVHLAARLARRLQYPLHRYSFTEAGHRRLERLYLPDEAIARRARRRGTPPDRIEVVGNLVADALDGSAPVQDPGTPHVLLFPGSRDAFASLVIPPMLALADRLAPHYPGARFVWPVSRMLRDDVIAGALEGRDSAIQPLPKFERSGDVVHTPNGARIEMIPDEARAAHLRAGTLAITIPGTNTLEIGIAGLPALVVLPMNVLERIPLEGFGHWLGLLPIVGTPLKRALVRSYIERLKVPISLPNRIAGEAIMEEFVAKVELDDLTERTRRLLDDPDDLARRAARLKETMPLPGAADRLAQLLLARLHDTSPT